MRAMQDMSYLRLKLPINSEYVVDAVSYRTQNEYYAVVEFNERDVERSLRKGFKAIIKQLPIQGKETLIFPSEIYVEEIHYEQKSN